MPVIAFAGLIVEAKHTTLIRDVRQPVFEGVPAYVAAHPPPRINNRVENLGSYHRRYAGLNRNGHRRMYVSFITADLSGAPSDWRAPTFGACDGGIKFFGVEYDLDSHGFTHIAYNGEL